MLNCPGPPFLHTSHDQDWNEGPVSARKHCELVSYASAFCSGPTLNNRMIPEGMVCRILSVMCPYSGFGALSRIIGALDYFQTPRPSSPHCGLLGLFSEFPVVRGFSRDPK